MDLKFKKSLIFGVGAGFSLSGFYLLFLTLANSFSHAISQFSLMWYWILILVIGFGIQVGLYFYIRESIRQKQIKSPTAVVATSGGISTGSMIACCLHHLVDVLPIIGLAAVALFLIKYQVLFIVIGILANLIGITIMLEIIQKNQLVEGFLKKILVFNMNQVKKVAIGFSLILFFITLFVITNLGPKPDVSLEQLTPDVGLREISLPTRTSSQGGISFGVTPLDFSFGNPVKFEIKIDTHSGSLDFDLVKISFLEDDQGNRYQPLEWQGSPAGSHHRSGILLFPKIDNQSERIKLVIQDISLRVFEWDLK